jgi:hypothetical protein
VRHRAAAAAVSRAALVAAVTGASLGATAARAEESLAPAQVLDPVDDALRIRSITVRVTGFDQYGHGYQAQGGPRLGAGSERAVIFEPQGEIVFTQGARFTHRVWIPVDVVTNASPDAIDVTTGASRHVESGAIDWTGTYAATRALDVSARAGVHLENPFRSWVSGLGFRRSFADDATVVSASALDAFDWFDRFDIHGGRHGRTDRNTTTGAVSLTQVLTPTTQANINYGITVQTGTLGNTWNSVPLASGERGPEILPERRTRHALVGRASQWLPWNGALRLYYRFYADDWGIVAHTLEGQLTQRLSPLLYVGGYYRFHTQTGASFFTTLAPADWVLDSALRVADSDLAPLDSHAIGGKVVLDVPLRASSAVVKGARTLHLELEAEHYFRTNDLSVDVVSWAAGFRF